MNIMEQIILVIEELKKLAQFSLDEEIRLNESSGGIMYFKGVIKSYDTVLEAIEKVKELQDGK